MPPSNPGAQSSRAARTRRIVAAAVILLAAGLRLTHLGLIEFKYDEATTARSALAIAREAQFPAMGMISSERPHNPALMSYVLALPFFLSRDPHLAAGWLALLCQHDRRLIDGREALVLPARTTAYLVHPQAVAAATLLADMATKPQPTLPVRDGSDAFYRFFRWQSALWTPEIPCADPAQWIAPSGSEPHATLSPLGYEWSGDPNPGGTIDYTLVWRLDGDPPGDVDLHCFNHLVDGDGTPWGQRDGAGLLVSRWRDGDVVLTRFTIPIAPDAPSPPHLVRTGLYVYLDLVNLPAMPAPGAAPAQFVELGFIDDTP